MTASVPSRAGGATRADAEETTTPSEIPESDPNAVQPEAGPSPLAEPFEEDSQEAVTPQGIGAKVAKKARPSATDPLELKDLELPSSDPSALAPGADPQLILPLVDQSTLATSGAIAHQNRVFCNRHLKMTGISWVGFDMDYTLAIYDQERMDDLSIRATIDKLIARGYPAFVRDIPHATDFPVRGLLIDKRYGHVLKMDRFKYVSRGYHGMQELPPKTLRDLYHSSKLRIAASRYHFVDTLYALSEVALYAALVEAYEQHGYAVDYGKLFADIRECIDEAHRDGTILDTMAADLPTYVHKDPKLAATLHKFRSAGKKLFVLTNSGAQYTEAMMTYLLGREMPEYPSWKNYFDVIVSASKKPLFFRDEAPFMERYRAADGSERTRRARLPFERGKIYEGGNLVDFQRALGVHGDEVLYVGDHIFGDILRSRKDSAWRTAMIIQELETEIEAHVECRQDFFLADRYDETRDGLEDSLRFYQQRFKELTRELEAASKEIAPPSGPASDRSSLSAERNRVKGAVDRVRERLRLVDREVDALERRTALRFHKYWGSLLKEGNEQSSFGHQVEDYACVYTSRVSNFANYSPQQTYRSQRDKMPHEMGP